MIFFDYYFKASSTPKYLAPVAVCMERRYQALMADDSTLKKFVAELTSELNSIPKAKERYKIKVDKGYIHIITTHEFTEAVIRLHNKEVLSLEGFSEDLCENLNEVAEKGGEK